MAATLTSLRPSVAFRSLRLIAHTSPPFILRHALSTLAQNPHIYVHSHPEAGKGSLLSLLPTQPPIPSLAIGTTPVNPPTPDSLTENPAFLQIVHHVIAEHAVHDPDVQAQAAMYASQAGSALGSGGVFFPHHQQQQRQRRRGGSRQSGGSSTSGETGAGGASSQGGMGGAGRGGYIHVADQRNPPDIGRVAWSEDIFGSLEVDAQGKFVDGTGRYQAGNTYRVITHEGVLGLSEYLRKRVVERLEALDEQARRNG